ncbi:hypothetical protein ABEB36_004496 [Hypothenemus hampei]|uniref:Conserved oligomeric Golgi complex subunit 8 n=1 Tax=Hypothenemus hampei TaxID=57062 RepID=A0ABD1F678_HYPHA
MFIFFLFLGELEEADFINEYLNKVGECKLEELVKKPHRLDTELVNIEEQTQDMVVTNYKSFIETADCSKEMFNNFNTIEQKLDRLLVNLPKFQGECSEFSECTNQVANLRKLNSLTLTKNAQLLEVLELPQLLNSFINDGLYEDALELASYIRKLCTKFSDIPIFQSILKDVDTAWLLMLHHLLSELKMDLNLSKCLQIVSYLRRMEMFTELELKLKFLQSRGHWLSQCTKQVPKNDVDSYLSKIVEVTRVNLFNVITQYQAIFYEESSAQPSSLLKKNINENMIFFTWINEQIADFLILLEDNIKLASPIESILDQCMYFGLSFSKVGCDFRPLLVPLFTKQIFQNFQDSILKTVHTFEKNMEGFTLINKRTPNIPWKKKEGQDDPLQPPDSLLEFHPLAEFLNNILKTFNSFRACAPLAIINDVVKCLQNSLVFVAKSIAVLHSQEQQAFTSSSKDTFTRFCMSFSDDLIPYIQKCLHVIYPPNQIATKLGVPLQVLQEKGISFFDKTIIVDPIKHLLPSKAESMFNTNKEIV